MPASDDDLQDVYGLLQDGLEAYAAGDTNKLAEKSRMAKELVMGLHGGPADDGEDDDA